ncbi:helix-turn-helix transcriptional regulator [Pseudonocardia adelaidensis]|uniref:helix-turn-helix transcriptional regulator n=1 Tax=Pseudonocardia adelaidensis TaxID=648754 RepID=UPI0031E8FBB4
MSADAEPPGAIEAVAVLGEEVRRRLYYAVRAAGRPVSRDEAATAVGISRKLAAFHLDKLTDVGLLRAHFDGIGRRGVGRKPKVYEPAEAAVQVSIPVRRHELLADILVHGLLAEDEHGGARSASLEAARRRGIDVGAAEREKVRPGRLGPERALALAEDVLARNGFEPGRPGRGCVRLHNCPFHPLATAAPELVCGLNHAFLSGMLDGLQAHAVDAVLAPAAGECCVELRHGDG